MTRPLVGDGGKRDADADGESWTDIEQVSPDLVEAVPVRHGMVLAGRYAIERIIGRGGSGVVVRAHDRDLRQVVAIKIVRAELAGQRRWAARLAREVRLARQIQHPHVCRVFDFQQAEGRAFVVMELAERGTLRDEIRSGALAARPLAERIADARAVASALDAIHRAGIVHRDLSTQNLLRMGDGRVVLSDFGLAVDVSESTSSVHGGTVAYMAPEVLLGAKASFAADIWALGIVMHELVFGVKPRWSEVGGAPVMQPPVLGRKLTEEERAALDACRACAAKDPARRLARAGEAGRLLTEPRGWWARQVAPRRPFVYAATLTVAAAGVVGIVGVRGRAPDARAPANTAAESPLIVPTGEAADWTDLSTVIAEVPDRIHCTRLLPDRRTIRFVWGTPRRAEDIDTVTRKRAPSPLVPAAYAEGCPDLSADGKRLVYQGHAKDGRAFAFLSEHPDGRDAVPVVPTAEPTMSSEPTWLADGETFSFDVDSKHMGVFSSAGGFMRVLPEPVARSFAAIFRFVIGNEVIVATTDESGATELTGTTMPRMNEVTSFRLPEMALDLVRARERILYASRGIEHPGQVVQVDLPARRALRIGRISGQFIRHLGVLDAAISFVSIRPTADLLLRGNAGSLVRITKDDQVVSAGHCGDALIVGRREDGRASIDRVDRRGRVLETLGSELSGGSVTCAPDGSVWYVGRLGTGASIQKCDRTGCRGLVKGSVSMPAASPDGARIAFIAFEKRGPIVKWVASSGGALHEVSETETGCAAGWASPQTLWVSRRRAGGFVWTEVDADSGRETGKKVAGTRDCSDGRKDPASPVDADLAIVYDQKSQLRLLSADRLPAD